MSLNARASLLLVVALALVGACSDASERTSDSLSSSRRPATPSSSAPSTTSAPGDDRAGSWSPGPLDWKDCDLPGDGQCARMTVPLDWSDPTGPTIDLAIGRLPAEDESIGPLLVNPGGPGGSGLEFLAADPVSPALSRRFDVVSWDPRGVGDSGDLRCGESVEEYQRLDPGPDDTTEQAALDAAAATLARECAEQDGDVLAHLGTEQVAQDMEAIRRALGAPEISYLGFSYGTRIGQEYLGRYPDRVRAMVLDGVVDPTVGYERMLIEQARGFEEAFDANADACARAGARRCGVDDLAGSYDRLSRRVESRPLRGGTRPIGPAELATAAIQTAYEPEGWRELGPALAAGLDGDGEPLWDLASSYYEFGDFTSYAAVVCIDDRPPQGAEAYRAFARTAQQQAPRFGAAVANELVVCADWPAAPTGDRAPAPSADPPTVLVVGNTGDPATPYANAVAVADAIPGAALLTVASDGHTAYLSDRCASRHIDRYLVEMILPPTGARCT